MSYTATDLSNIEKTILALATGTRKVRAIDKEDLSKLKTACLARGNRPKAVKSYFRRIKAALNYVSDSTDRQG